MKRRVVVWVLLAAAAAAGPSDAYLAGLDALERGAFEEAVDALLGVVAAEDESADAHLALGVACVFHEKLALARKHLTRADQLRPNHKPARMCLASAMAMDGESDSALRVLCASAANCRRAGGPAGRRSCRRPGSGPAAP
jgi:Flp pilus assembly protein TadD